MKGLSDLPKYKRVTYTLSIAAGYYVKNDLQLGKIVYNALPNELKREPTVTAQVKSDTEEVLTKPEFENGARKLFTGLRKTLWPNWYLGEHRRRNNGLKINSLLLIHFTIDKGTMSIFLFPTHTLELDQQHGFAANMIPVILKKHFMVTK